VMDSYVSCHTQALRNAGPMSIVIPVTTYQLLIQNSIFDGWLPVVYGFW